MQWFNFRDRLLQPWFDAKRRGLISDFDGTLSPIVPAPQAAQMLPEARAVLRLLQPHLSLLALVSGRAAADLASRADLPGAICVGNHGLERWDGTEAIPAPEAAPYLPVLAAAADALRALDLPGVQVEDKGVTLALHYRQASDPESARVRLAEAVEPIARARGLLVSSGRMVIELRPPVKIDKGTTLRALVAAQQIESVIFLGDDRTDLDAMRVLRAMREAGQISGASIAVVTPESPSEITAYSDASVASPAEAAALLGWLLSAFSASST